MTKETKAVIKQVHYIMPRRKGKLNLMPMSLNEYLVFEDANKALYAVVLSIVGVSIERLHAGTETAQSQKSRDGLLQVS